MTASYNSEWPGAKWQLPGWEALTQGVDNGDPSEGMVTEKTLRVVSNFFKSQPYLHQKL